MAPSRPVLIRSVNWWWYLLPIAPILGLGYAALIGVLPPWSLMIAIFGFFMWVFSLAFALFTILLRRRAERTK